MAQVKIFPEEGGTVTVVVYKTRPSEARTCSQAHVRHEQVPEVAGQLIRKVKRTADSSLV